MIPLYPLRFKPIYKEKIWGGRKLHNILGKDCGHIPRCGESWELSAVEGNISVVSDGPLQGKPFDQLINEYRSALVGKRVYERFKNKFPLLIKFLDAREDLSIQVHPGDSLAMDRHNQTGKTEMWYIIQSDPGSSLITGFDRTINATIFEEMVKSGRLQEVLNREEARAGDVFFIPAGRIHTIGKGILLAEIQQTSDVTYRVYDFDRVDPEGNKRELHVEEAKDALDYEFHDNYRTDYEPLKNRDQILVECPYFTTRRLELDKPFVLPADRQTFRIMMFIDGDSELHWDEGSLPVEKGDVYLIPAALGEIKVEPVTQTTVLIIQS